MLTQQVKGGGKVIGSLLYGALMGSVLKGIIVFMCVQTGWHKVMAVGFHTELLKGRCNSSWLSGNWIKREARELCQVASFHVT